MFVPNFTPAWATDPKTRRTVFSQMRDLVDNDNQDQSPAAVRQRAADLEAWAASRANEPAFARFVFAATVEVQQMRRRLGPSR